MNNASVNRSDEYFHQTMDVLLPYIHPRLDPDLAESDVIALLFRLGDHARIGDQQVDLGSLVAGLQSKADSELTDEERQVIAAVNTAKVARRVYAEQLLIRGEHGDVIADRDFANGIITIRANFLEEMCYALVCCTQEGAMGDREAVQRSYAQYAPNAAALQDRLDEYVQDLNERLRTLEAVPEEVYEDPMELVNVDPDVEATDISRSVPLAEARGELCPICHEDFETEEELPVRLLSCGHLMGADCLRVWINGRRDNHNTCPCCRAVLFYKRRQYRYERLEQQFMDSFWHVQAYEPEQVDSNIPHQKAIMRYMITILTSFSEQLAGILADLAPRSRQRDSQALGNMTTLFIGDAG